MEAPPSLEAGMTAENDQALALGKDNSTVLGTAQRDAEALAREATREVLSKGVGILEDRLKALDVAQPTALQESTDVADRAAAAIKLAKACRAEEVAPWKDRVEVTMGRWSPVVDKFIALHTWAKNITAMRLKRERDELDAKRAEAEAALVSARAAEVKAREDHGEGLVGLDVPRETMKALRAARVAVDELPPVGAPLGARTDAGTFFSKEVWGYEVLDISKVPNEYLTLTINADAVERALEAKVRDIPGLRIFPREQTAFRGARVSRGRKA